jgi:HK97 family phage major capsid protein
MKNAVQDDPVLANLRASWQTKHDEAQKIIDNPSSTGEALVKAERLFDERDRVGSDIEDRTSNLMRVDQLKSRYSGGESWASTPVRTLPFSSTVGGETKKYGNDGAFHLSGFEAAGHSAFKFDSQAKHWEMIGEAGPGTFGEKQWATISSFEYKKDWALYLRKGQRVVDLSTKTLQEGLDDQGGVFAPAELIARVIGRLPAPTKLRSKVTTLTTGRDTLILPRKQYSADDKYTTAFRVTWTGEIPFDGTGNIAAVNDQNLLGNIDIQVHTAMLNAPVTRNLIEDAAFPIQAWLEGELAQVIDLTYEDMILNGSITNTTMGAQFSQPIGILFGANPANGEGNQYPEVILTSTNAGIDYGSLIDVQTALAPQYETDTTCWVFNKKSTYRALNKLVDSQNRPLFTTGYDDSGIVRGRGNILLGDEICKSQFSQDISATNYPIVYGDMRGYFLAQRVGFSIQVLDQTRAKANQIELVGRVRFGGRPVEPFRLKLIKSNPS